MLLFTPGPTPTPENIRLAMSKETIHHRTSEFEQIFKDTRELLFELIPMHEVLILASSGTGAMEACVTNLVRNKALTINSGKFGERFGKICDAHNIPKVEIKNEWNTAPSGDDVLEILRNDSEIDTVCLQICESAGGLRHNLEEIAYEVKKFNQNITIIADGITAVGVETIDFSNIDALIAGSQKAFMLPPGLSTIWLSQNALEIIDENSKGYYFNLKTEIKNQQKNTTAWTAPTTLIMGLKEVLQNIFTIGLDEFYSKTKLTSSLCKEALEAIGLNIYPNSPAIAMTTIEDDDANQIRTMLKNRYEVNVAGGQDHLKGHIFRINHMGFVKDYEILWLINSIELILDEIGRREYDATATKIFSKGIHS